MSVEIGIRIKSDNMTGKDFDKLVGDLKRAGQSTEQVKQSADNLRNEFDALGNKIHETSKLTLDANGRWKDAEGNILNTQQASKRLESALSDVSDEQLRQISVVRDAEGRLQDVRGGYISTAEASRRFAQGIERTSREFAEADKETLKFSNTLTRHRTELRNVVLGAGAFTAANALLGRSLEALQKSGEIAIAEVREFDRLVVSSLREAQLKGDTEAVKLLESAAALVVEEFKRLEDANIGVATSSTRAVEHIRNYSLELIELEHNLRNADDAFRGSSNVADLTTSTQTYLDALEAVYQVRRDEIEAQLGVEGAALTRLSNQERAESEHANKIQELAGQLRQLELTFEQDKTRITRDETEKRTQFYERATELRIATARRAAEVESQLNSDAARNLQLLADAVSEYGSSQRQYFVGIVNAYRDQGQSTERAIDSARNFITLEQDKTRITRDETEKRTQFYERATELRIATARRAAEVESQLNSDAVRNLQLLADAVSEYGRGQRQYFVGIVNAYRDQGQSTERAIESARNFITLTEGMGNSLQRLETGTRVFGAIFRREFTETVLSGARLIGEFNEGLRAPGVAALAARSEEIEAITRLEAGQSERDQRTGDRFAAAAAAYNERENRENQRSLGFVSLRREQPFSRERLFEDTGSLVASVPFDVVDAITNSVQLRRDGNSEILRLEQEAAAEIQIIQESVTLGAENKAKAIERIERQSALQRIRIENEVSERQRASFQAVVTNFVSGIARMIAAEAQLALARRATSALRSLFSGGAAAVGGAGLATSVLLPLVGGLGLAYGAAKILGGSSPSAEVYQRSHYGTVGGSGGDTTPTVQPNRGTSRAAQEGGVPNLEANLNITVEASGTRLAQSNSRVRLKTVRWGG